MSVSEYVKTIISERHEDLYDLKISVNALEDYKKNPIIFAMDEVFNG